jgi:Asp-tRNA(Asn)/Glu-tRNA(Gln) amidotransferase A subunit family amidase
MTGLTSLTLSKARDGLAKKSFTSLELTNAHIAAMAGLPGVAAPAGKDPQGLPLGVQLIGRPFDEETLSSLGEVIEQPTGRFTPPKWWA